MQSIKVLALAWICLLATVARAEDGAARMPAASSAQESTAPDDVKEFSQDLEDAEKKGPGPVHDEEVATAKPKKAKAPVAKKVKKAKTTRKSNQE